MTSSIRVLLAVSLLSTVACRKHVDTAPIVESMPVVAPKVAPPAAVADNSDSNSNLQLEMVFFATDSSTLTSAAKSSLAQSARSLSGSAAVRVEIQGHADERGTTEYNLALGERRASAVRAYLSSQGVAANRMTIVSYGEERPMVSGDNEGAWAKNRRAELVPKQDRVASR